LDISCSCDLDLDPMTFIYQLTFIAIYRMCKYELGQDFRKLSSDRHTGRQTQVRRGHFRSRDNDGGRIIRSAVVDNPANLMALSFLELELWAIEVYITGIGILYVFGSCDLDLM